MENIVDTSFKRFEIGIAEIDAQHWRLFGLLGEMRKWSRSEFEHQAIVDILSALDEYALIHFSVEESVMRMLHYPHTAAHIAEHKKFADRLHVFRYQFLKKGRDGDIDIDIVAFIESWLVEHIDRSDRAYVDYFLAKGINPQPFP